jgi:UDP-2-acetamido-3-amino-2,3-dideoxy-glucuronate N-acetyltransferase
VHFFKHESSICETALIGRGTKLWAFTHILANAGIGEDCNICDFVFIENDVTIGNRVTIKSGVQVWDGVRISDDVFIGPNVTFCNDKYPRSKRYQAEYPITRIERGASIGANATILPGITLGEGCVVGAGSVVTKSVPPFAIVYGNPARIKGYDFGDTNNLGKELSNASTLSSDSNLPGDCKFVNLANAKDSRGKLMAIELNNFQFFNVQRIFYVYDVPSFQIRGEHAHKSCYQLLIAVKGSLTVQLDDGSSRVEVKLNSPQRGLLIPPMVWGVQFEFSPDAVLCVLASQPYDPMDYIRSYAEFQSIKSQT